MIQVNVTALVSLTPRLPAERALVLSDWGAASAATVAKQGYRGDDEGQAHGDSTAEEQAHVRRFGVSPARPGSRDCGLVQSTARVERGSCAPARREGRQPASLARSKVCPRVSGQASSRVATNAQPSGLLLDVGLAQTLSGCGRRPR